MQPYGSPILELLVMQGIRRKSGLWETARGTWRGYRVGGVGGALIGLVSAVAGLGGDGSGDLAASLAAFRADPATDPALRDILRQLQDEKGVEEAVGEATLNSLSARTGLSRPELLASLSQSLPVVAQDHERRT